MTISIKTKTNSGITAFHQEQDGEAGFVFNVAGSSHWLSEAEATRLAEYVIPAAIVVDEQKEN